MTFEELEERLRESEASQFRMVRTGAELAIVAMAREIRRLRDRMDVLDANTSPIEPAESR